MGDLPGDIGVSIPIPVGIVLAERSARFCRIETPALQVAEIQAEVGVAEGAVDAAARAGRVVRPDSRRDARRRRVLAALGEDLDHAPDRVGAVQAAQLPGHDLDPLDLAERNVLERRRAERGGADPHAVHQDQRMTAVRPAHKHAARLSESAVARGLDPAQHLQHLDQSLLAASGDVFGGDDIDRLQRLSAGLRKSGGGDDYGVFRTLSKRERRRGRDERGNDRSFQGSSPACVPAGRTFVARGNATTKRTGFPPRPAAFPTIGRGRSPGLRDRAYRLPVSSRSQWQFGLIRPHTLTVAGAAEALAVPAAPLSRFTPARGRAGTPRTSALIVQHKSRGSALRRHRESTLKTNPYTLT